MGTGRATSVGDLHAACRAVTGADTPPVHAPARPGDVRHSVVDPSRAAVALGFVAKTKLADGLERTWSWVQAGGPR